MKELKVIEFKKCPICGSEERYCESLAIQEKARGHMRRDLNFCLEVTSKTCDDAEIVKTLPVGTEIPAYTITKDICMGFPDNPCGNIYVTSIVEGKAVKKSPILVPGQKGNYTMPQIPGISMNNPNNN